MTKAEKVGFRAAKPVARVNGGKYKGPRLPPTKALIDEALIMRTQRYYSFPVTEVIDLNREFVEKLLLMTNDDNALTPDTRAKVEALLKDAQEGK